MRYKDLEYTSPNFPNSRSKFIEYFINTFPAFFDLILPSYR